MEKVESPIKTPASKSSTEPTGQEDAVAIEPSPEIGGRDGPEPTRFGDWEKNGRCIDF